MIIIYNTVRLVQYLKAFKAPAVFISHQKAPLFKFTAQFIKSLR